MRRRIQRVLFVVLLAALIPLPASGQGRGQGKGKATAKVSAAARKQLQRVANRLISALRRTRPLKGFVSERVTVTYHTSDRSEGEFEGKVEVAAAAFDGPLSVPGKTGGTAWVPREKKITPRPKTVKLHVGKMAYTILKEIREEGRRKDLITVDSKALTLHIESGARGLTFHVRPEGLDKLLRVYKVGFSEDDPG